MNCHKKTAKKQIELKCGIEEKCQRQPVEILTEKDTDAELPYPDLLNSERRTGKDKSRIMYIEYKGGRLAGTASIGRVRFSKSGKSIYYNSQTFKSLKGKSYKANYYDVETGEEYWISGCRKKGDDTLYPGIIEIDEDVLEEYWVDIRNQPENVRLRKFRSEGKYSKRRPK